MENQTRTLGDVRRDKADLHRRQRELIELLATLPLEKFGYKTVGSKAVDIKTTARELTAEWEELDAEDTELMKQLIGNDEVHIVFRQPFYDGD